MRGAAATLRGELIGLAGVVERNVYLVRRYVWWEIAFFIWTVANTLTIVFIAKGIEAAGGTIDVERTTTTLLIGPPPSPAAGTWNPPSSGSRRARAARC